MLADVEVEVERERDKSGVFLSHLARHSSFHFDRRKKALEIMLVETRERLGGYVSPFSLLFVSHYPSDYARIAEELKTQVHALEKELLTKVALEESRVELRAS